MSKLEELIEQYCPDGVEWHPFFDVCDLIRGITYNKEQEAKTQADDAYKVLRANNITLHLNILNFEDVKLVSKDVMVKPTQHLFAGDILMCAGSGSKEHVGKVAFIPENMDYTFGGFMAVVRCKDAILPRFVYHILTSGYFSNHLDVQINSSTINNINKQVMQSFEIPVPPLPVQEEIVRILDTFTELKAELKAELQKRKQQYNYYLDNLLNFKNINRGGYQAEVRWMKLKDVCMKTSNIKWKSTTGQYRYIDLSSVDIQTHSIISTIEIDKMSAPSRAQQIVQEDDVIFATTRPTQMRACIIPTQYNGDICSTGYCVLRVDTKILLPRFLFFSLTVSGFKTYLSNNLTLGNYPSISNNTLLEYEVPVPSLANQQRIVSILDRFDRLTNDLTSGLPAEIEKRRQQYEYYRDKLLTFKRKGA